MHTCKTTGKLAIAILLVNLSLGLSFAQADSFTFLRAVVVPQTAPPGATCSLWSVTNPSVVATNAPLDPKTGFGPGDTVSATLSASCTDSIVGQVSGDFTISLNFNPGPITGTLIQSPILGYVFYAVDDFYEAASLQLPANFPAEANASFYVGVNRPAFASLAGCSQPVVAPPDGSPIYTGCADNYVVYTTGSDGGRVIEIDGRLTGVAGIDFELHLLFSDGGSGGSTGPVSTPPPTPMITSLSKTAASNSPMMPYAGPKGPGLLVKILGTHLPTSGQVVMDDITVLPNPVFFGDGSEIDVALAGFGNLPEGYRGLTIMDGSGKQVATMDDAFWVSSIQVQLELNQGVPLTCTTAKPCIADHDTVIRAKMVCNGMTLEGQPCQTGKTGVTGRLFVSKGNFDLASSPFAPGVTNGSNTITLYPSNIPSNDPTLIVRRNLAKDALNFYFTDASKNQLSTGQYSFTFEIDPLHPGSMPTGAATNDQNNLVFPLDDNLFAVSNVPSSYVTGFFNGNVQHNQGTMRIAVMSDSTETAQNPPNALLSYFEFVKSSYPVSKSSLTVAPVPSTITYVNTGSQGKDESNALAKEAQWLDRYRILGYTHLVFISSKVPGPGLSDCYLTEGSPIGSLNGFYCKSTASLVMSPFGLIDDGQGNFFPRGINTNGSVGHELGHSLFLGDSYSDGVARNPNLNPVDTTPNSLCTFFGDGCPVDDGNFDTVRKSVSIAAPTTLSFVANVYKRDIMGKADRPYRWNSTFLWNLTYPYFNNPAQAHAISRPLDNPAPVDLITVRGVINQDLSASLLPFYRSMGTPPDAGTQDPTLAQGAFSLELQSASGQVLDFRIFLPNFTPASEDAPLTLPASSFSITLPFAAGTSRLVIKNSGMEIASRQVSPNPPVAQLLPPPNGPSLDGTVTLSWSGADVDGDALTYSLLYSADGGQSWLPIAIDLTATSFAWDTTSVPGSANARIELIANDGVNETTVVSDPLTVANKPPFASIASPDDGSSVSQGQPVTFVSSIYDLQDGETVGGSIIFTSDRDGQLGQGPVVTVSSLSVGDHTITMTVTNAAGLVTTASIKITVTSAAPQAQITPTSIDFGSVAAGMKQDAQVVINNAGTANLAVSGISVTGTGFSAVNPAVPVTLIPGDSTNLTVRFTPPGPGPQMGNLAIASNDPANPLINLPLMGAGSGVAAAAPQIMVAPARVDFGDVPLGQSPAMNVTVTNTGTAPLNISSLNAGGDFSVASPSTPFQVAVNATATVAVVFSPTTAGLQTSALAMRSDDPSKMVVSVPLAGTGHDITSSCTFTLSATTASVPAASSATSLQVAASAQSCAWSAASMADWIVITSGSVGTGTGGIAFSVAANPTTSQRVGTLTIAGITFTVTQAPGTVNLQQTDTQVTIDGGTFTQTFGAPAGWYVNRLTPPGYPAVLKNIEIYFGNRPDGLPVNTPITLLASTSPVGGSSFNGQVFYQIPGFVNNLGAFNTYPMPSATINSGDFIVGFAAANPPGINPADVDVLTPSQQRSYFSTDAGATFALLDSTGLAGNFAIRATITVPGTGDTSPAIGLPIPPVSFGAVLVNSSATMAVTITNTGAGTLNVKSLATAAPFAVISPATPFQVAANSSATVMLCFNPTATGGQNGSLNISSDDPNNPSVNVSLSGTGIAPQISLNTISLAFGNVLVGQSGNMSLSVTNKGTAPLNIRSVTTAPPFAIVSAPPTQSIPPNATVTLNIAVSFMPPISGNATGSLTITSDDPINPSVNVSLSGTGIAPQISLSAPSLAFGNVTVGQSAAMSLTVANKGTAPLNITKLSTAPPFALVSPSAPLQVAANSSATLSLSFNPTTAGAQSGTLTISSDDTKTPSVSVSLSGTGVTPPQISVSPASLSFGSVTVGKSATLSVTVTAGSATLNLSAAVTSSPAGFSLTSAATFTEPGTPVTVQFAPATAGNYTGTLTVTNTNDPAHPLTVPLSGTGTAPAPGETIIRTLVYNEISSFTSRLGITGPGRGASYAQPALDTNGTRFAFAVSDSAGINHVYVMNTDGTGQLDIDHYAPECFCGSWVDVSADGSVVVSSDHVQLRIVSATGSGFKKLVDNRSITDFRITGDGKKVYFINRSGTASTTDPTTERGVYVVNADGTGLHQVVGPAAVAALLGVTADAVSLFSGVGPGLDISADGSRVVFAASVPSQQDVFAVNGDGSGLHRLLGPYDQVQNLAISGDGSKVGYYVSNQSRMPDELGAINFDGSSRLVLNPSASAITNADDTVQLTADGTVLLAGTSARLYNTDGTGVLQLSVGGTQVSGSPLATSTLGGNPVMNGTASRLLYLSQDDSGSNQWVTLDIDSSSPGMNPQISNPTVAQEWILNNGSSPIVLTAKVAATGTLREVNSVALYQGLYDSNVQPLLLHDDGKNGDATANDGVFSDGGLGAFPAGSPGPRTLRVKAEIKDPAGRRHATAIDFAPFFVVKAAPSATLTITSLNPASGPVGTLVTLSGSGFDPVAANNVVLVANFQAQVTAVNASGTSMTIKVPQGLGTGPVTVTTAAGGATSNTATFTIVASPGH